MHKLIGIIFCYIYWTIAVCRRRIASSDEYMKKMPKYKPFKSSLSLLKDGKCGLICTE